MLFPLDGLTHDSFRIYLLDVKIYLINTFTTEFTVDQLLDSVCMFKNKLKSIELVGRWKKREIYIFSSQYLLEFPMGALLRSNRKLWKPLYSSNWIRMSPIQSKCNNSPAHIRAFYIIVAFLIFLQFISQFLLVNCSSLKPDIKQLLISVEVSPKKY